MQFIYTMVKIDFPEEIYKQFEMMFLINLIFLKRKIYIILIYF